MDVWMRHDAVFSDIPWIHPFLYAPMLPNLFILFYFCYCQMYICFSAYSIHSPSLLNTKYVYVLFILAIFPIATLKTHNSFSSPSLPLRPILQTYSQLCHPMYIRAKFSKAVAS